MAYYGQPNPQQNQQFLWGIFQKLAAMLFAINCLYSNTFALVPVC